MDTILFMTPIPHEAVSRPLDGVRRYARARGWHVQVIEEVKKSTPFKALLDLWQPVGIVAACGARFPEPIGRLFGKVPFVAIDRDPRADGTFDCPTVAQDNAATGRIAAKELLSLGLRNYAFAGNSVVREWDDARRDAYIDVLAMHGYGCHLFPGAGKGLSGYPPLLAKWLPTLPRPVGIFCTNDWVADRVCGVCNRLGLNIPHEFAVLGVDNDELICNHTHPTLTSICPDFERSGYLAAELLDRNIASRSNRPQVVRFGTVMTVHRGSTAGVGCADAMVSEALRFIRDHSSEPIGVDDVASVMKCSRRLAQTRFKCVVGKSIHDTITDARMEGVFLLLRRPEQSIGSIASLTGLGTEANLRHVFKLRTGLSLSGWRNRIRSENVGWDVEL